MEPNHEAHYKATTDLLFILPDLYGDVKDLAADVPEIFNMSP